MTIIVGAGLAGLTCARSLHLQGRQVLVLEAGDGPGGRLRTRVHPQGFLLDRGFQVLFTAYPAARRVLSFSQLDLRSFQPGVLIARRGRLSEISDPFRNPGALLPNLFNASFGFGDKMRVAGLRRSVSRRSIDEIFSGPDQSTHEFLAERKFSDRILASFFEPFFGGIFLDRSLSTSAQMFQFVFKMLSEGRTVIPARGMEAIPQQLAREVPYDAVRYGLFVQSLIIESGEVRGVLLSNGEALRSSAVVVATDAPEASRLTGVPLPTGAVSATCVYFATETSLYPQPKIVLNAEIDAYVNNLVQLTNIAPEYAPPGQHLVSATILGLADGDDRTIAERCRQDIARLFPKYDVSRLRGLDVLHIPYAQFAQPPGVFSSLNGNTTPIRGLYLAGEFTVSSSIQGAIASGEAVARQVVADEML